MSLRRNATRSWTVSAWSTCRSRRSRTRRGRRFRQYLFSAVSLAVELPVPAARDMDGERPEDAVGRATPAGNKRDAKPVERRVRILEVAQDTPPIAAPAAHLRLLAPRHHPVRHRIDG